MFKVLRIIFCVLTVMCAAAVVFVFVYAGTVWGLVTLFLGVVFALGMFACRSAQIKEEIKANPPAPKGDFITGKVSEADKEDKKE